MNAEKGNLSDNSQKTNIPNLKRNFDALLEDFDADLIKTDTLTVASFSRNPENLALAATSIFESVCNKSIQERGLFSVSLCGGRAPKPLFELLKRSTVDWSKVHIFWGDERPPRQDVGQTNYQAAEGFLKEIKIPPGNVHRIDVESADHGKVASDYGIEIQSVLGETPQFDLMILGGGGKDQMTGHTMGLMRNSEVFAKQSPGLVVKINRDDTGFGYTMTPRLLQDARQVMVLLPGQEKVEVVHHLIDADLVAPEYPIAILNTLTAGKTIVMTDQIIGDLSQNQ